MDDHSSSDTEGFSDPAADHGGWEYELPSGVSSWSAALYRIHGVLPGEFEPTSDSTQELIHPGDQAAYARCIADAIKSRAPFTHQHRIVRPNGDVRTLLLRGSYLPGSRGEPDRLVGTTQDLTDRTGQVDRLWHLANHDPLTGLFNRRRFTQELEREVAVARRTGSSGAVVMIDLDRFKDINDTVGHVAGDNLLIRVAEQLRGRMRITDTVARLGGDEFAIVLPACSLSEADVIARELLGSIRRGGAVRIAGTERPAFASAGIAPIGGVGDDTDELMVQADLAMYRAKADGGNRVAIFDEELRAELSARVRIEGELRDALVHDQLDVHYQPIVSLADGSTVGCEALVRWRHRSRGLVTAGDFIPIAEQHGLIGEIGGYVLETATRAAASWRRHGSNAYISVNVSPLELMRDNVADKVKRMLAETRLPAPLLQLEVTETSLIDDARLIRPALDHLKRLGIRIAIDDFGGGTSSLSFLSALPIDVIKVDRLFVQGLVDHADDRAIVAAVISMAEELELTVVAEGVEDERQQGELRELGCRFAQGFLYAVPMPVSELALDSYSPAAQPGVGDPSVIREFMRQIGIPARLPA